MKQGSTLFLRAVIFLMALAVLTLCIFGLPVIIREVGNYIPEFALVHHFTFICIYAAAVPFYLALYQTLKLLKYIDTNKAFSALSIKALKNIKLSAISMTVLYLLSMPLVYIIAEKDDAPGLIIIGMVIACAPLVIAVFAAVLQKLVQNELDVRTENELTI